MRICSLEELRPIIEKVRWQRFLDQKMEFYRGHGLTTYLLKPGITRYDYTAEDLLFRENNIGIDYDEFCNVRKDYVRLPFSDKVNEYQLRNKWYSLFQAQHLGLKTRFMDWTISFETALLFAVDEEKHHGQDGSFWIFRPIKEWEYNDERLLPVTESVDPYEVQNYMMINTPTYMLDEQFDFVGERRMGRQSGRFWCQSMENCLIPMDQQALLVPHLTEIIIDGDSKAKIKQQLHDKGYTLDWHYYRKDGEVDEELNAINIKHL